MTIILKAGGSSHGIPYTYCGLISPSIHVRTEPLWESVVYWLQYNETTGRLTWKRKRLMCTISFLYLAAFSVMRISRGFSLAIVSFLHSTRTVAVAPTERMLHAVGVRTHTCEWVCDSFHLGESSSIREAHDVVCIADSANVTCNTTIILMKQRTDTHTLVANGTWGRARRPT